MTIRPSKTKELIVRDMSVASLPQSLQGIKQVDHIKLLYVISHHNPIYNWDLHFDMLLAKAEKRV